MANATMEKVDKSCAYCGEDKPVRVLDYDGYAPNEVICAECFSHGEMCWDDLQLPIWPREAP